MQDLYGNPINDNNNTPSIDELYRQGLQLNSQLNDPFYDFDVLTHEYPAFSEKIQSLRNEGIPDRIIDDVLKHDLEPRLNFIGNKDAVNSALGRTPESQQEVADFYFIKRRNMLKQAHPDASDDDITNAIGIAQWSGVAADTLLKEPALFKKLTEGQKLREGLFESAQRGFKNYVTQRDIAHVGSQYLRGVISKEEAYRQEQELSQNFIQEPLITTPANRFIEGGSKVTTQGYYTLGKGVLYGTAAGTLGGIIATPFGMTYAGAMKGYEIGQLYGAFNELFELQAGADMLEFSKMTDSNGKPINENAARAAACITGAITTFTELIGFKEAMKLFPGADKLLGLNRETVKQTLMLPAVQDALSRIVLDTAEGIGWSTFNNVIESLGHDLGIPLAQAISGQPFPHQDLNIYQHVLDTITSSLRDFSASSIPGMLLKLGGLAKTTRQYKQTLSELSQQLNIPEADIEQQLLLAEQTVQSMQNQTEIQPETQTEAQTAPVQQKQNVDYIYVPTETLRNFLDNNVDISLPEGINAGSETGFTPEQFETLKSLAPQFIAENLNEIRYGTDGHTISEAHRKVIATDEAKSEFYNSPENQKAIQNVTQEFIDAGEPQEEAESLGQIAGALNASFMAREGVQLTQISVNPPEQETQTDASRLNPEYDINNPDTWPNQERAQQFKEASTWGKLPEFKQLVKDLFDVLRGKKPERADELEPKSQEVVHGLEQEAPSKAKSTRNELARQELREYIETLKQADAQTIDALNLKDNPDPSRYEFNSTFPKGKSRNPNESYYFDNFNGQTRIDLATEGANLFVRVKSQGNKETAIFSIKNFRTSNLRQILSDILGGSSADGIPVAKTPAGQFIAKALRSFWDKMKLKKAELNTYSYTPDVKAPTVSGLPKLSVTTQSGLPEISVTTQHQDTFNIDEPRPAVHSEAVNHKTQSPAVSNLLELSDTQPPDVTDLLALSDTKPPKAYSVQPQAPDIETIRAVTNPQTVTFDNQKVDTQSVTFDNEQKLNAQSFSLENGNSELGMPDEILQPPAPLPYSELDYNPGFDDDSYSPDFEHNFAAVQDTEIDSLADTPDAEPPALTDSMPVNAQFNLARDESQWHKSIDSVLNDSSVTTQSRKQIQVMRTPLVFTLVGAKHLPININNGKLKLILRDHKTMSQQILMDVPRALTDPIAIFEAKDSGKGGLDKALVVLTELKDGNGASIITAFHLDQKGDINKLASSYPQSKKNGSPRNEWFRDLAVQGNLLYLNTDKAQAWNNETGVDLLPFAQGTKNQNDLLNLWRQNDEQGYYYTSPEGEPLGRVQFKYGKAVIELVQSDLNRRFSLARNIHDVSHVAFQLMANLADQGSQAMTQDFETILRHADVTREQWIADKNSKKGGAREKAHEYFAQAFEKYMYEGKAPTKRLQPLFDRVRKWLLEIYDDISNQLNIELDDEVREVFDRLLTMPGEESSSVADIALQDIQVSKQIDLYQSRLRELENQYNENMQMANDPDLREELELQPDAVRNVEEWINDSDLYDAELNEYEEQLNYVRDIAQFIREQGGLNYQTLVQYAGKDAARDIYNKWRSVFSRRKGGGHSLDDMAHLLYGSGFMDFAFKDSKNYEGGDESRLFKWLEDNAPDKGSHALQPPQYVPQARYAVDNNLINALSAALGIDGTIDYLQQRKLYLERNGDNSQELPVVEEWLNRFSSIKNPDDDLRSPVRKPSKRKISRRDLKQAASTGYALGEGKERELQKMKQSIRSQRQQERFDAKLQALRDARQADKAKHNERLKRIRQTLSEQSQAREQRTQSRFQKKIDALKQRIKNMQDFRNSASEKSNINRMVKGITRMAKSQSISYSRLQEINDILQSYNLSRQGIRKRDLIRDFLNNEGEQYTADFLDEAGITQQEIDAFADMTHIEDMTLRDVRELHQKVSELYQLGRREFAVWQAQRDARRTEMHSRLAENIFAVSKAPEQRVITGRDDINRQFWPGMDTLRLYWDSVQTPGRFLAGLGENFREILDDGFTIRRGEAYSFIHQREINMMNALKSLGLRIQDFMNIATTIDGKAYSWEEIMSVYLSLKNEQSRKAVLWGNFISNLADSSKPYQSEEQAMNAINQMLQLLEDNPQYKQAAELILQDFDSNFDRINQARIRDFNKGINQQENYTPMFRLRHQSNQGLIDAETEQLASTGDHSQILRKVYDNFTISRQNIAEQFQQPIDLHIWANWMRALTQQEFSAALGGYAADVVSALLIRGNHGSIQELIKSRLGTPDWNTLRSIFNDSIVDSDSLELDAANKIAAHFIKARSFAYVAFNPISALTQTASFLTALPYSNRGHLMRSLFKFIDLGVRGRANQFLESVYQKSPELRFTGGDPIDRQVQRGLSLNSSNAKYQAVRKGFNAWRALSAEGYKGVMLLDNWTKSIVFDAVYQSNIDKGLSEQEAINLANRAVHDTQPASSNREATRFNRAGGITKLMFSQFMNALAPIFNMAVVDVARNLTHPSWNSVKAMAWELLAVGLTIGFAGGLKDFASGNLPSGQEQDDGEVDSWSKWLWDTETENLINTVPMFNFLVNAVRAYNGNKVFRSDNRLIEPFELVGKAIRHAFSSDDDDDNRRGLSVEEAVKGLALLGAPIPYSGIKPFLRFFFRRRDEQ